MSVNSLHTALTKLFFALFFASCLACSSGKDAPARAADDKQGETVSQGEPVSLVLWHAYRGAEAEALEAVVADWNASEEGKASPVQLEANPDDGFSDKLSAAIPNGNGPDLFIFAHDRIGGWAKSGFLAPLQDFVASDTALVDALWPETLPPLQFQEQLYGLPLAYKNQVLFYNTKLLKEPPKTTEELLTLAKGLTDPSKKTYGLVYPHSLLFFHSSWLFGFGGSLFSDGKPKVDTPENARSIEFAKKLLDANVVPKEVDGADAARLFNAGQAAMVINGPWFRGDIAEGVPYAVSPLPLVTETQKPASPFMTVEAVLISEKSAHKKEAYAFARYLTLLGAKRRLLEGKQSVATKTAYELPEAKKDEVLQVFLAQLHRSTATPNIPEMAAVWTPFDQALTAVMQGRSDAATALKEAQSKIEGP